VLEAVQSKQLEPYQDVVASTPLVAQPPEPGQVVETREISELGVTEWQLANGIRVILKQTDFKADEVLVQAFSPGGLSLAPDSLVLSASLATAVVSQSGVGDRSLVELRKELAGNTARVSPFVSELEEGLEGRASPRDLETLLQLSWLYVTSPRADSSAFASVRDRLSALLANRDASPEAAFGDTVQLTLAQHHPRQRPLTVQRLSEWDLDRSIAFYRERFSQTSDWTFVVVGAFDKETLRPLVERWIGGLPDSKGSETWRDTGIRPPASIVEKTVRKGIEPRAQTLLVFTGPAEYKVEERHRIGTLADVLDIRLREVLREDLSGTYGAGVSGSISRAPEERYTFQVGFGAEPERLEELVAATFAEIERLQGEGPDTATLAKVKETQRREWQTNLRENGFWLGQLARAARDGADPRGLLGFPARVDALTTEMIRDAARKYLSRERYVRVSLLPAEGS
jgi:zinc protease